MAIYWCLLLFALGNVCYADYFGCSIDDIDCKRSPHAKYPPNSRQLRPMESSCDPLDLDCQHRVEHEIRTSARKFSPLVPIVSTCSPFDFECKQRHQLQWRRVMQARMCSDTDADCMAEFDRKLQDYQNARGEFTPTVAKKEANYDLMESRYLLPKCMPEDLPCWIKHGRDERMFNSNSNRQIENENYDLMKSRYLLPKCMPEDLPCWIKHGRDERMFNSNSNRQIENDNESRFLLPRRKKCMPGDRICWLKHRSNGRMFDLNTIRIIENDDSKTSRSLPPRDYCTDLNCWIKNVQEQRMFDSNSKHPNENTIKLPKLKLIDYLSRAGDKYLPGDFFRFINAKLNPSRQQGISTDERVHQPAILRNFAQDFFKKHIVSHPSDHSNYLRKPVNGFYRNGDRDSMLGFYSNNKQNDRFKGMVHNFYSPGPKPDSVIQGSHLRAISHGYYNSRPRRYTDAQGDSLKGTNNDLRNSRSGPYSDEDDDSGDRLRNMIHDFYNSEPEPEPDTSANKLRGMIHDFYNSDSEPEEEDDKEGDRLRNMLHDFYEAEPEAEDDDQADRLRNLIHDFYSE